MTPSLTYRAVFQQAFGGAADVAPYAYQCRLAGGADAGTDGRFAHGTDGNSRLIEIPTGLGKTAGVILAWLWNRRLQADEKARAHWPRRLIYCLPMRTLVEQTAKNVSDWLERLQDAKLLDQEIGVHILMGGEDSGDWDMHPEREVILIGTQDMLLSRALKASYRRAIELQFRILARVLTGEIPEYVPFLTR